MAGWFLGELVGWLIGWLVGWLVGQSNALERLNIVMVLLIDSTSRDSYLGDGADDQRVHPHLGVVGLLLAKPGVNDVVDTVNRQRSLCDVRRDHHLVHAGIINTVVVVGTKESENKNWSFFGYFYYCKYNTQVGVSLVDTIKKKLSWLLRATVRTAGCFFTAQQ